MSIGSEPHKRQEKQQQRAGETTHSILIGNVRDERASRRGRVTVSEDTHIFWWFSKKEVVGNPAENSLQGRDVEKKGKKSQMTKGCGISGRQDGGSECRQLSLQCWQGGEGENQKDTNSTCPGSLFCFA